MTTLSPGAGRSLWIGASIVAALFLGSSIAAQSPQPSDKGVYATRAELQALANELERPASANDLAAEQRKLEARAARERLQDGDFQVGDRVILRVQGDSSLTDTFTVRAGRMLNLPNMQDIALTGVLRSELQSHLAQHIGRYIRNPQIQIASLMRVGVLGRVARPGYYVIEPDALLSDAIMLAGGPGVDADIALTTIRRGAVDVWPKGYVRDALSKGRTLDQLSLRAGDEIVVGERRRRDVGRTIGIVTGLGGLIFAVIGATSR